MKKYFYITFCAIVSGITFFLPRNALAQCTCSSGDPATPVTYYSVIDTTSSPSTTVSFPKFNPSIGNLSCIDFFDTLSLVATSTVQNLDSSSVNYQFLLNVSNDIEGPGVSVFESASRTYGPTTLTKYNTPGDTVTYGPDTLFNTVSDYADASGNAADYLGSSGNVDFEYTVNGGLISQKGGLNYNYHINSKYWGAFRLTYYWCPASSLATNIKNFYVTIKDKTLFFNWIVENESNSSDYEIEISNDGKHFSSIGNTQSNPAANGSSAEYSYQYYLDQMAAGKLYFRIKKTDATGKVTYSEIKLINLNADGSLGINIYPNPVARSLSMHFDKQLQGSCEVSLINAAGQVVLSRRISVYNTDQVQLPIPQLTSSGLYYLRVRQLNNSKVYNSKLFIRQ